MLKPCYQNNPSWKDFFPENSVPFFEKTVEERWIPSGNTEIHLDVYVHGQASPTIIYCHGLSSCARMMGHVVKPLYEKGYNVICPDLVGFGMTVKPYGSGTIDEFVGNVIDVVGYAKREFSGPIFLTGISLGGVLSYYTAARGADVNAIACLCLLDLAGGPTRRVSKRSKLVGLVKALLGAGRKIIPNVSIPIKHILDVNRLSDDSNIIELFKTHPLIVRNYTFRAAHSLLTTAPDIPFEKFDRLPVLVLHAEKDQLIPLSLSQKSYEQLAAPKKFVILKNCEHVPLKPEIVKSYVEALDGWFRAHA